MVPVEDAETGAVSLGEHSWNRVLKLPGCCIYRFREGGFGGLGKVIDQGSERAIDCRNFSFPIVFAGRYDNL